MLTAGIAFAAETGPIRGVYLPPDQRPIYLAPGKAPGDYRNVALNPTAVVGANPFAFPHATSNDEYNQQEFKFARRTVTSLVLKDLKPDEDKWCALCECEVDGRDAEKN